MADKNGNSNCLEDLQCPECGEHTKLQIRGEATFTVMDDGTDEYEGVEWDANSPVTCPTCQHSGEVFRFRIPKEKAGG